MPAYIRCRKLCKTFPLEGGGTSVAHEHHDRQFSSGRLDALDDISFDLNEGDVLGVIGLNGAGKSTLLKILSGVQKPTSGEVEMCGSVTSILEQSSVFSSDLTGIENLIFFGNILGYKTGHIRSKIKDILSFAGLEMFGQTQLKNYSTGMKLRLAFGLMKELSSDILMLDEALGVGDRVFQEKISATIDEYLANSRIVLIATHDFNEITRYCNKCLLLEHGRAAFFGNVQEAVSIFYAQNRGKQEDPQYRTSVTLNKCHLLPDQRSFTIQEPITFMFEYEIKEGPLPLDILLTLTGNGPVLIDSPMFRPRHVTMSMERGVYRQSITIPPNLLNVGTYRISLLFGDGDDTTFLKSDNILTLSVVSDGEEKTEKLAKAASSFPIRFPLSWSNV